MRQLLKFIIAHTQFTFVALTQLASQIHFHSTGNE